MITYKRLKHSSDRTFQSITGLTKIAFQNLFSSFENACRESVEVNLQHSQRERKPGGGAKPTLEKIEDRLVMILFYVKNYPTQDVLGVFYGTTQAWSSKWVHYLMPMVQKTLGDKFELPVRPAKPASTIEELFQRCPELKYVLDGTERPIQRPKDKKKQKENYSGKKKRHTIKNTILTNKKNKKVVYLGPTTEGKKHDKKMADEEEISLPEGSIVYDDLGYVGYSPPGVHVIHPKKKPCKGELTATDKEQNQVISRERIGVEHSIGGVKIFRIVHDIYRNHKDKFDDLVMEVACGLYNHSVSCRAMT
jgi:hypothetical protein